MQPGHVIGIGLRCVAAGVLALACGARVPAAVLRVDELGAYQTDKMAKLGYLQSLLFRAARLVVDTGIHSQKWTRADAVTYLENTTGMARADVEFEIDRYIIWPGQACAYMAGRETIKRLRASEQQQLKGAFDIKAFHQTILGPGPRPLPVLEADIVDWVQSLKSPPVKQ